MPMGDALTPAGLSQDEKDVLKSYGGWERFLMSMGLKFYKEEDAEEGEQILRAFGADKARERKRAERAAQKAAKQQEAAKQ